MSISVCVLLFLKTLLHYYSCIFINTCDLELWEILYYPLPPHNYATAQHTCNHHICRTQITAHMSSLNVLVPLIIICDKDKSACVLTALSTELAITLHNSRRSNVRVCSGSDNGSDHDKSLSPGCYPVVLIWFKVLQRWAVFACSEYTYIT